MTSYTTRIVLYGYPTADDYKKLHAAMAARGFSDEIASDDGTVYKMPDAEYDYSGNATITQVYNAAKAAADSVWTNNAIFVSEAPRRKWSGLKVVRQARRP